MFVRISEGGHRVLVDRHLAIRAMCNRASELTRVDDPRGYTLRFDYDGRGRKTLRRAEDSNGNVVSDESYGYNATNQMDAARNGHAEVVATYDEAGKLKTVDRGSENTAYSYTNARLSSRTDPAGATSYGYDGQGRISSVTDPFTGTQTTFGYTEAGRLKTRDDASGISHSFSYDPAGRLDHQTSTHGTTEVASFDPIYDASSNVIEQTRQVSGSNDNGTWSYVYDHANRLRDAIDPDSATISYKYDAAGNRTEVTKNSNTTTTTYNQASRPESSSDSTTYDHDAAGNLIQIAASAGTTTYDYDPWNRMTQATVPGDVDSITLDYSYDALERLMTKQDAAVAENTTTYAHSGLEEEVVKLTESDSTSSVTSRYLHFGQAPLVMERGGQIRFFGTDPHADVVYLADGSGTLVGDHSYSPWGEKRTASGEDPRFEFQGDRRDEDTGLVDMGARLYSPELGRFTTTDPLRGEADRPTTLNRYAYALDNPVSNLDPTGLYVPQYGHQDRGTKTSPKRAQTASIGTSTSNVASSTRASSQVLQLLQIKVYPKPRPAAVVVRRSSNPLTHLEAWVDQLPGFSHVNNWLQEKNHPLVTPGHGDDVVGGAKAIMALGGVKLGIAAIRGGAARLMARLAPAAPALENLRRGTPPASSAAQGARLNTHLRLLEQYGRGGSRTLSDGRIRYYGNLEPARKSGAMAGRRLVLTMEPQHWCPQRMA